MSLQQFELGLFGFLEEHSLRQGVGLCWIVSFHDTSYVILVSFFACRAAEARHGCPVTKNFPLDRMDIVLFFCGGSPILVLELARFSNQVMNF